MLVIRQYVKRYNDTLILSIDKLTLAPGVYWIKGENGSGKSTLFKSIAGIIPFEGDISFESINQKEQPVAYRKIVNYAEAEPMYPGFLTAKDLIRFIGKAKGATLDQQKLFTNAFGVNAFFEKTFETFSSGMMKKLSLVLAFLGTPKLIILDEPLITLDEQARKTLLAQIKTSASAGTTFLLSSHQLLDDNSIALSDSYIIEDKKLIRA